MCSHRFTGPRHLRGFTFIELLVTIAIVAILTAVAAPSFNPIIQRWRVRGVAEDLQATLYYARSEAIKRSGNISISAESGDWNNGWKVTHTQGSDTTTLQINAAPSSVTVSISDPAATTTIIADRWGMLMPSGSQTATAMAFEVKSASNPSNDSTTHLCIGLGGRLVQKKGSQSC